MQLPDILAVVFTANLQSLEGTLDVAKRLSAARDALPVDRKGLPIVPILSRFDAREEKELGDRWLTRVAEALGPLYSPWLPASVQPRQILERTLIPYVSYWSFGEKLPPLEESAGNPETIAWSLESIAALVANGLGNITELIRNRDQFVSSARLQKHQENISHDVFVSHAPREGRVAVQIADGLRSLGRRVFLEDPDLESAVHDPATSAKTLASSRHLLIIVRNELSRMQEQAIRQFVVGLIDRTIDSRVVVLRTGDSTVPLPPVLSSFPLVRLDPAVERTAQTLDKALGMSTVHEGDVRTQLLTLLRNRRDQLAARGSVGTQWITQIRSLF